MRVEFVGGCLGQDLSRAWRLLCMYLETDSALFRIGRSRNGRLHVALFLAGVGCGTAESQSAEKMGVGRTGPFLQK